MAKPLTGFAEYQGFINDAVDVTNYINLKDLPQQTPPEYLPAEIEVAFKEAATCQSTQCWNASAAMYRSCIDLATKALLPTEGEPNRNIRHKLGLRLEWLFDNQKLPTTLKELSHCIQQDGNDGVHDVNLTKLEVEDVADFTVEILETIYTIPGKLQQAQLRRDKRREQ
jgi:hypothetical protein